MNPIRKILPMYIAISIKTTRLVIKYYYKAITSLVQ